MRLHFVTVPIHDSEAAEEELNRFLATHRVIAVERHLVVDGARSAWAVCVTWVEGARAEGDGAKKGRVDYRERLNEAEFALFVRLRDARKKAAEQEGVPPYAVFTNEQLAEMVRRRPASATELAQVEGVGAARVEKYGALVLDILRAPTGETAAQGE